MQATGFTKQERYAEIIKAYPPSFIDEILQVAATPGMISFAGGLPDAACFPGQELAWAFQTVLLEQPVKAMQYNVTEGYLPLRAFIASRFSATHGCLVQPEQVLITHGAQQALDLVARTVINPGDGVLVEDPTFIGVLQAFAPSRPTYYTFDRENLPAALADIGQKGVAGKLKVVYTMPRFQNPTGLSYTGTERNQLLSLFNKSAAWVVEDDAYGELSFEQDARRPFFCDLDNRGIYIGSFSKSIAPSLRTGWMIVPPAMIEKIAMVKRAADTYNSFIIQLAVYHYLVHCNYDKHIGTIRAAYKDRCNLMLRGMSDHFPTGVRWTVPQGGMFSWVTLPPSCDAMRFSARLLKEQLAVVPGKPFFVHQHKNHHLRLNFSNTDPGNIGQGIERIGALLQSELAY